MSLRMGEDIPATILPPRWVLSSSLSFFPYHFPQSALMTLSDHHYVYHFSAPLFLPLTTCLLLSHAYSITSFLTSLLPSLPLPRWELLCYHTTLTMLDAACVCLSWRDRCEDLELIPPAAPHGSDRGRNDKRSPGKYILWSRAATGAEIK